MAYPYYSPPPPSPPPPPACNHVMPPPPPPPPPPACGMAQTPPPPPPTPSGGPVMPPQSTTPPPPYNLPPPIPAASPGPTSAINVGPTIEWPPLAPTPLAAPPLHPGFPPHLAPSPLYSIPPPPGGHHSTIIAVCASLGAVFFLAFLAIGLFCLAKKKKKPAMVPAATCAEGGPYGDGNVAISVADGGGGSHVGAVEGPPYQPGVAGAPTWAPTNRQFG